MLTLMGESSSWLGLAWPDGFVSAPDCLCKLPAPEIYSRVRIAVVLQIRIQRRLGRIT